ncbi:hypothetical protein BC793_1351 [Actinoplanes xinjiangensis]|uniref:Transposase IS4-like domain-containing protein n=1 Tax=Actinoplanes xinjiangensis TaxID=512350 RepID=A0A316EMP7_9ACTN|nr:transposase [Actinoplanes xinjiangensis]PWK31004.1 hypothetical protein BC793_1351 [Actinoplanes xinjiangensis]
MRPVKTDRETLRAGRLGRLRLLLVTLTLLLGPAAPPDLHAAGLPISWSLADAKADERQVLAAALEEDPGLLAARPGQLIIADKGYVWAELDRWLAERGARLLRPSYRNRTPRPGEHLLKPVRQLIESVNDTLKGQLDLELHGGRSIEGVGARVAQRLLAMTAAIWHNRATGQPLTRSLIAYDH